jgi:TolB-like protein
MGHVFTWRNALLGGLAMGTLLTIGTAGYSGLRSAGIGPLGSLVARGVFDTNKNLIFSGFEDETPDGTLGEMVSALFRTDLSQTSVVHVLGAGELSQLLIGMQRDPKEPLTHDVAVELAQQEGIEVVISGEVLSLGSGVVISIRLVATDSGETLVALRETARTVEAVPDAVSRLSAKLRVRIGEPFMSIQGESPTSG